MTQMISKTQVPGKRAGRLDPIAFFERFGVLIFMILLLIFFQLQNSNFLSERNIFNILTEVSIYGIMAVGMTFVILTAGIDLSVGSILAVCAMTAAYVIKGDNFTTVDPNAWGGLSWLVGLGICLAMGTAIGFLHGLGVTRLRLPPFIVTLGGMTILARPDAGGKRRSADRRFRCGLSLVGTRRAARHFHSYLDLRAGGYRRLSGAA